MIIHLKTESSSTSFFADDTFNPDAQTISCHARVVSNVESVHLQTGGTLEGMHTAINLHQKKEGKSAEADELGRIIYVGPENGNDEIVLIDVTLAKPQFEKISHFLAQYHVPRFQIDADMMRTTDDGKLDVAVKGQTFWLNKKYPWLQLRYVDISFASSRKAE